MAAWEVARLDENCFLHGTRARRSVAMQFNAKAAVADVAELYSYALRSHSWWNVEAKDETNLE